MSKVAIKGADTGTGVFTIESPATNTDRTLTLPDEAGTILTSGGAIDVASGAPADSVAIDSAGNLLVGGASNYYAGTKITSGDVSASEAGLNVITSPTGIGHVLFGDGVGAAAYSGQISYVHSTNHLGVFTNGLERMRIDASGNFLVGKTIAGSAVGIGLSPNGTGSFISNLASSNEIFTFDQQNTGVTAQIDFRTNNVEKGSITFNNTNTSFNTTSDYRLKEDLQPVQTPIDRVNSLNPVNFAWKVDGSRVDGFLAHEVQAIVPNAVYRDKDEVDGEGNPKYQSLDHSKLVPLLTAALQEAINRIETLEARVATLEGGA